MPRRQGPRVGGLHVYNRNRYTAHPLQACETTFLPVAQELGGIADITFSYIASADPSDPTGFNCMHGTPVSGLQSQQRQLLQVVRSRCVRVCSTGDSECEGDITQLCVAEHFPSM